MHRHFVVTPPLPLILLPNESLVPWHVQVSYILKYYCEVPYKFHQIWLKNMAMHNGKTVLHIVINLYVYVYICIYM